MTVQNPPIFLQSGSHPAEDVRRQLDVFLNPLGDVVMDATQAALKVSQHAGTPAMSVDVASGRCVLRGSEATYQGTYFCENRGVSTLTISTADATNPRIDLIVAKVQDTGYSGATNAWSLAVVTGTPAASPSAPAIPNNAAIIAQVAVAANATSIVNANVTDKRQWLTARGGTMICTSSTLPSTAYTWAGLTVFETDKNEIRMNNGGTYYPLQAFGTRSHGCRVTHSTTQTISSGGSSFAPVNFDTEDFDTDAFHDTVTNNTRMTIPTGFGGLYLVKAYVRWQAGSTTVPMIAILKNGLTVYDRTIGITAAFATNQICTMILLAAGDYIQVGLAHTTGSNANTANGAANASLDPEYPVFEIQLLSGPMYS